MGIKFDKLIRNRYLNLTLKEIEYQGFNILESSENRFSVYLNNTNKGTFESLRTAKEYIDSAISGN